MNTEYKCVTTVEGIKEYIGDSPLVAFDFETAPDDSFRDEDKAALDPAKAHIVGCSFSVKEGTGIYVSVAHRVGSNIDKAAFFSFLAEFLTNTAITKIAHNIAFESSMAYGSGIVIQSPVYDTICASQMSLKSPYEFRKLNESGLKRLAEELFGEPLPSFSSVTDGKHFDELDAQDAETVRYGSADSDYALRLYHKFNSWFDRYLPKHRYIVENIESPTAVYLGIMKSNGIPVNLPLMQKRKAEAETEMECIRKKIEFIIGDVNIGANCSTQEFKNYLYKDLGLPILKTTETNREAADDMTMTLLKEWCDNNRPELSDLFSLVQEYRKWGKIKSTYIDGYLKHLNPVTGCIHPDIFALSTDTGRMEAQRHVQEKMLVREAKMSQIIDAEKQWRLLVQSDIRELNANPYIINVRNGLYNVLEDTLTEHTPNYYSTVQLNVTYDKAADCPLFKKFLEESMGGDMEQVKLIQEMLGYFLIPVNSAQKCFVIVGAAGAGKSVLLRVLNDVLLGKQNVSNVSWQALNERFKTAELFGKLANIFADLPTKNIDDNGIFKALVGEDYLTVEKKNKNPFSFQSSARLLFSCNSIPKNYGDRSEGFYRRLIIIRFNHTVPQDKRDPELLEKFRMEADGIFLFALEGLRRLMNNHYVFSETQVNADELQQYREESDSVLSFVKDYCELDAGYSAGSTELFDSYKKYCEECGMKPYSQKNFVQQILATFPNVTRDIDRVAKRRVLTGIRLGEVLG